MNYQPTARGLHPRGMKPRGYYAVDAPVLPPAVRLGWRSTGTRRGPTPAFSRGDRISATGPPT